jgi:hypothetical protein
MGFGHLRGIFRFAGLKSLFRGAGLKSREVFSRPLKGTLCFPHPFPPLKRRAITRRPAARDWSIVSPAFFAPYGVSRFARLKSREDFQSSPEGDFVIYLTLSRR